MSVCSGPHMTGGVTGLPNAHIKAMGALRKSVATTQWKFQKSVRIEGVAEFDRHSGRTERVGIDTAEQWDLVWNFKLHISQSVAISQSPAVAHFDPHTATNARTTRGESMWGRCARTSATSALLRDRLVISPFWSFQMRSAPSQRLKRQVRHARSPFRSCTRPAYWNALTQIGRITALIQSAPASLFPLARPGAYICLVNAIRT